MINILAAANVVNYLQTYGYIVMFVLMFIEGPIVTYIASFIASQGFFHIYWVLLLSIIGSFLPDVFLFWIGRLGMGSKVLNKKGKLMAVLREILSHMDKHPGKSIAIIKMVPGVPVPGLILIGKTNIKFLKFVMYILMVGIPYALFFTALGYYSGLTFSQVSKYMRIEGIILIAILAAFLFFMVNKMSPKIAEKLEKDLKD